MLRKPYTADQVLRAITQVLNGAGGGRFYSKEAGCPPPAAWTGRRIVFAAFSVEVRRIVPAGLSRNLPSASGSVSFRACSEQHSRAAEPRSSSFQHTERDGCPAHVVKAPCGGRNVLAHARTRAQEVPEFVVTAAISSG
jgi:hypothetical protein